MELQDLLDEFAQSGIGIVALSSNTRELAEKTAQEWGLDRLTLGYGIGRDDAERWGLFVSQAIKEAEPDEFVEPALFVVRADGTLYASVVQTMPFTRPPGKNLLQSLQWVIANNYPARGEMLPGA